MEESLYKLDITTEDRFFTVDHCQYECDGLILAINRGDEQFVFNMDYVKFFRAEREVDEDECTD